GAGRLGVGDGHTELVFGLQQTVVGRLVEALVVPAALVGDGAGQVVDSVAAVALFGRSGTAGEHERAGADEREAREGALTGDQVHLGSSMCKSPDGPPGCDGPKSNP